MSDFIPQNADKSLDETFDAESNALDQATQPDETYESSTDADKEKIDETDKAVPLTAKEYVDWFDEEDEDESPFLKKLQNVLSLFALGNFISRQEFAVAFGVAFGAFAFSLLLLSVSLALDEFGVLPIIFATFGSLGVLGATLAFIAAALNRFNDANLFDCSAQTSQEKFLLAAFKNFGLSFVWITALFLAIFASVCAIEAYDDHSLFGGGLCALAAWFFGALSLFGLVGSALAVGKETTQRFHSVGCYVWNADGWRGNATRQDFLLALVNYAVATFATAFPYALASAVFCWGQEEILLGFLAILSCFLVSSLIFGAFLLPASARRLRTLGLDPRATLLYLLVPAPYMALVLVAFEPIQPKAEKPEFYKEEEEEEEEPNLPF
jgi:hypothetical protein